MCRECKQFCVCEEELDQSHANAEMIELASAVDKVQGFSQCRWESWPIPNTYRSSLRSRLKLLSEGWVGLDKKKVEHEGREEHVQTEGTASAKALAGRKWNVVGGKRAGPRPMFMLVVHRASSWIAGWLLVSSIFRLTHINIAVHSYLHF